MTNRRSCGIIEFDRDVLQKIGPDLFESLSEEWGGNFPIFDLSAGIATQFAFGETDLARTRRKAGYLFEKKNPEEGLIQKKIKGYATYNKIPVQQPSLEEWELLKRVAELLYTRNDRSTLS